MIKLQSQENHNDSIFGIYVMSYNRYDRILTDNNLEYCKYVVRESQSDLYRKALGRDVVSIPDTVFEDTTKDGAITTFEWIVNNTEEDIIALLDDDIEYFLYRLDTNERIEDKHIATEEIERIAQLMLDLEIGYGTICGTSVPYGYDAEFGFKGSSGACRWINKGVYKAKCDQRVKYNFDVDIVLQELLLNRIILQPKYFCAKTAKDKSTRGSSEMLSEMNESLMNMKYKWKRYFEYDTKKDVPKIAVKR